VRKFGISRKGKKGGAGEREDDGIGHGGKI